MADLLDSRLGDVLLREERVPNGGVGYSKLSLWHTFILNASTFKSSETSQNSLLVVFHIAVLSLKSILIFLAPSFNLVQFFFFWTTLPSLWYEAEIFSWFQD